MVNGLKEGFGTCFFPEGSRYVGEWRNDLMHGLGKLYYSGNVLAYEGQWANNEFHGSGKVYCFEPVQFDGPFDWQDFNLLEEEWVCY